ncbi:uncharacterized protein A4U43_C04F10030 [Asparagus officinalis]|uniref:Uncharacterized protein n=1 Tax=Asparagus officinalis TaxID=4686 RepID=A0A5P1EZN9_ASPOF|nr:uncharacterized protein A4U43_C04F10030 [Asparagus officinalis]
MDPTFVFPNPNLRRAYIALQDWKQASVSDPSPSNLNVTVVAGIDFNHSDIAGYLPEKLSLLSDLVLFHINSNRFKTLAVFLLDLWECCSMAYR